MDMARITRPFSAVLLAAAMLVTNGCGSEGNFELSYARSAADYRVVDLETGEVSYRSEASGLPAPDLIRDRYLVFRLMKSSTFTHGLPAGSDVAGDSDEQPVVVSVRGTFVSIFELTTAQWLRITRTTGSGDSRPQTGVSLAEVRARLQQFSARTGLTVRLPTDSEWEVAARITTNTDDGGIHQANQLSALVRESALQSASVVSSPQAVGSRAPTGIGLYDMVGNVWEWTATTGVNGVDVDGFAHVRGGSWSDSLATARVTNIVKVDPDCAHPDIGFRVVMNPD